MHWVLQNNLFTEPGFQRLLDALERLGIPHSMHKVVPFVGDLVPEPDLPANANIITIGSYSMGNYARRKGWQPGALDSDNLDYEKQLPHWGTRMLNSDALVCRFADVPQQIAPFFIRPTLDSKSFSGTVMDWADFSDWQQRVLNIGIDSGATLDADTLVMVCRAKTIYREYRLWVVDSKIVTASLYKEGHRVHYSDRVDQRVLDYASELLGFNNWEPAMAYVLDICECDEPGEFRIIEAGCMSAAGFYAADMQKIVMALETAMSHVCWAAMQDEGGGSYMKWHPKEVCYGDVALATDSGDYSCEGHHYVLWGKEYIPLE